MKNLSVAFCLLAAAAAHAQTAGGKVDPCTLVSKAEIQEAIGVKVGDGVLNKKANQAVGFPCEFKVEPYGAVSFLVTAAGPSGSADKTRRRFRA